MVESENNYDKYILCALLIQNIFVNNHAQSNIEKQIIEITSVAFF